MLPFLGQKDSTFVPRWVSGYQWWIPAFSNSSPLWVIFAFSPIHHWGVSVSATEDQLRTAVFEVFSTSEWSHFTSCFFAHLAAPSRRSRVVNNRIEALPEVRRAPEPRSRLGRVRNPRFPGADTISASKKKTKKDKTKTGSRMLWNTGGAPVIRWLQLRFGYEPVTTIRFRFHLSVVRVKSLRSQWRNASVPADTLAAVTLTYLLI